MKSSKGLANLIEKFYDAAMSLCRINMEGKGQIQDLFLLRLGTLVIDTGISFSLRLEAIRTINSILDMATKEERKKFSLTEDHCLLLQEFAEVIPNVGDYEMQVALSEALCRMTVKRCREELVHKWFSNPAFGDSFKAINDREFETDCRKFLNEVNNSFGDERRVFTFPCVKAFLDLAELFMPDDKNLDKFWIDFNLGTSCISFFVNDPEGTLWESVNLQKAAVSGYNVLGCDDQKILTVQMAIPISHGKTKGKTIQIIFDSQYDIVNAVKRVFGEEKHWQRLQSVQAETLISETPPEEFHNDPEAQLCPSPSVTTEQADVAPVGQGEKPEGTSLQNKADAFQMEDHSDTEVESAVSETMSKDLSHIRKNMSFMAALRQYQVARARARIFSQSASSNGSGKSTPGAEERQKETKKGEHGNQRGGSEFFDYSRKKPKPKTRLKILPLSSASSAEESDIVKHSTPIQKPKEREEQGESTTRKSYPTPKDQSLDISGAQTFPGGDSGFPEELEDTVFTTASQDEISIKAPNSGNVSASPAATKRKSKFAVPVYGLVPEKQQMLQAEGHPDHGLKPRRVVTTSPLKTTDRATTMLSEDTESETEMGSAVITAFQTFKNQLREHFSARYKKIESRSLKSLTDCQNHVSSLLGTVHRHRLLHLERFQATVVNELNTLEHDCLSLKDIERETVNFWRAESQSVASFCDKQQKRLQSLELLRKDSASSLEKEAAALSSQTTQQETTTSGSNLPL